MKIVAVIPTYNEKENIRDMAAAALAALPEDGGILFVDDNSPDGTGAIADSLAAAEPRIRVLHREKKEGLGRAYIAGFREAMRLGAERIIEMDCDFSHPVARLRDLLAEDADVVIGSRYVKGGKCIGWPFKRWLISKCGGIFIRTVTGMPIKDPTGGFKCFRRRALEKIGLDKIESNGYSFQLEMNHRMWMAGFTIKEIPIVFAERQAGYSKLSGSIAVESVKMVLKLWRDAGFRRSPRKGTK
ncbi:MAG: polyprenol monophosphomannose synthase [Kiritimatiellae bacterium]|nr:polyprenol monophosphomannose synthase [Kiritimatiellia bacterium]